MIHPNAPNQPDDSTGVDTEGKTLPPYEGRRESGEVGGQESSTKDGVKVGGATGPVEDKELKSPEPADTPRGATGSPSDEHPASDIPVTRPTDDRTGPAHQPGTGRAEDKS